MEAEGPATVKTVVTKLPSTDVTTGVTTGDATAGTEVVDVPGVREVDEVEVLLAEDV